MLLHTTHKYITSVGAFKLPVLTCTDAQTLAHTSIYFVSSDILHVVK